ncbi:MAG: Transposase DNA-binding [Parachlamydiales bacterium]|nr:Transposase DNA-binding [Parachlamydiales bacterium]
MLKEIMIDWVRKTWADVKLGDRRRNQRAIKLANSCWTVKPAKSIDTPSCIFTESIGQALGAH